MNVKFSAARQSYMNRRNSNSFRRSVSLDLFPDGSIKSPVALFRLVLYCLSCLFSLLLGFRFSRLVFFFIYYISASTNLYTEPFWQLAANFYSSSLTDFRQPLTKNRTAGSKVVVGRHGIRIRPWPHPNPIEIMKAHHIIQRVQIEQRIQFGMKNPRAVIAVTPTFVRTFQRLHITGVMHSLMLVPYDVVWIVVEAGGVSNETASIIAKSGIKIIHVGFRQNIRTFWEGRHELESEMRMLALRVVRERKLDGIVVFADDSNIHSIELFDEIQNVKWFGTVSVGMLAHSDGADEFFMAMNEQIPEENPAIPVQGPACNAAYQFVGWHTFGSRMLKKLEWAGFVLNSRALWKGTEYKPEWIKDLDSVDHIMNSPISLLKDPHMVEPLGSCGQQILVWWLRIEANSDSKFPLRLIFYSGHRPVR